MLSRELREFAQVPDRYTRLSHDVHRDDDGRRCIVQGTVWAGVAGVRVDAGEVEALVEEARALVPAEKSIFWWIDPDAEPADLHDRLLRLGFRRPDDGHTLHALACVREPAGAADVEVARVETFEEFVAATELQWEVFETPRERQEAQRPHLKLEFEAAQAAGVPATFLARLDGRPAGVGRSIYSDRGVFLIAGSVLPWARGRGVYRALVRARWDDAVARGTPGFVVEALPDTSYPILKRLGFEDVCTIRRLEDPRGRYASGSTASAS